MSSDQGVTNIEKIFLNLTYEETNKMDANVLKWLHDDRNGFISSSREGWTLGNKNVTKLINVKGVPVDIKFLKDPEEFKELYKTVATMENEAGQVNSLTEPAEARLARLRTLLEAKADDLVQLEALVSGIQASLIEENDKPGWGKEMTGALAETMYRVMSSYQCRNGSCQILIRITKETYSLRSVLPCLIAAVKMTGHCSIYITVEDDRNLGLCLPVLYLVDLFMNEKLLKEDTAIFLLGKDLTSKHDAIKLMGEVDHDLSHPKKLIVVGDLSLPLMSPVNAGLKLANVLKETFVLRAGADIKEACNMVSERIWKKGVTQRHYYLPSILVSEAISEEFTNALKTEIDILFKDRTPENRPKLCVNEPLTSDCRQGLTVIPYRTDDELVSLANAVGWTDNILLCGDNNHNSRGLLKKLNARQISMSTTLDDLPPQWLIVSKKGTAFKIPDAYVNAGADHATPISVKRCNEWESLTFSQKCLKLSVLARCCPLSFSQLLSSQIETLQDFGSTTSVEIANLAGSLGLVLYNVPQGMDTVQALSIAAILLRGCNSGSPIVLFLVATTLSPTIKEFISKDLPAGLVITKKVETIEEVFHSAVIWDTLWMINGLDTFEGVAMGCPFGKSNVVNLFVNASQSSDVEETAKVIIASGYKKIHHLN